LLGDEWERVEASVERLFGVDGADIRGHTVVYDDDRLRRAVERTTGGRLDQSWRFFFATRLQFRPPLPPGIGPAMVKPMVQNEGVRAFVDRLEGRGVTGVERGRTERVRTERGRVRFRQVTGELAVDTGSVPVEGWVGVSARGDLQLTGGAYPTTPLSSVLDGERVADLDADLVAALDRSGSAHRGALFDLLKAV
jgi:hypothetical protein